MFIYQKPDTKPLYKHIDNSKHAKARSLPSSPSSHHLRSKILVLSPQTNSGLWTAIYRALFHLVYINLKPSPRAPAV